MRDWHTLISTHDSYLLLLHSIVLPKLLYCLCTASCFLSPQLQQHNAFSKQLCARHSTSTSPMIILHGLKLFFWLDMVVLELGVLSAFLASAASSLLDHVLPPQFSDTNLPSFQEALALWTNSCNQSSPEGITSYHQKSWDIPTILAIKEDLLISTADETSKSLLLIGIRHLA